MVNWFEPDITKFREDAREQQQFYCDQLGDRLYDEIKVKDWDTVFQKIGYGLYGPPLYQETKKSPPVYAANELLCIYKIMCQMIKKKIDLAETDINFACVFVVLKMHDVKANVPVFKFKRPGEHEIYIDQTARVYKSWEDFLKNNTLPKCIVCYPSLGYYFCDSKGNVRVDFGLSPACKWTRKVLKGLDIVSTVATVGAVGVGVAAICSIPVAGPIAAASTVAAFSTGAYGVARSTGSLIDRGTHNESVSIMNAEARGCWINMAGSSLGFAQGKMISAMTNAAMAGKVMGQAGRIAFIVVRSSSIAVNAAGIIHGLDNIITKKRKKQLTPLDIFQFGSSLLFFCHAAVEFKTADRIISDVQEQVLASHRSDITKQGKVVFDQKTSALRGEGGLEGNAKVIKALNKIGNTKEMFDLMGEKNVASRKMKLTENGAEGHLIINKGVLKISPNEMVQIPKATRNIILTASENFEKGIITSDEFRGQMETYCTNHKLEFNFIRKETASSVADMFGEKDIEKVKVRGKNVFANATPHELDRLSVTMKEMDNNADVMKVAVEFAVENKDAGNTFYDSLDYCVAALREIVLKQLPGGLGSFAIAKAKDLLAKEAKKILEMSESERREYFKKLKRKYDELKLTLREYIDRFKNLFKDEDENSMQIHHVDVKGDDIILTQEICFQLAAEKLGCDVNVENTKYTRIADCAILTHIDSEYVQRIIKIDKNNNSVIISIFMCEDESEDDEIDASLEMPIRDQNAIFRALQMYPRIYFTIKDSLLDTCEQNKFDFEAFRKETTYKICRMFKTKDINQIEINNKKIFANLNAQQSDAVRVLLTGVMENRTMMFKLALKFASQQDASSEIKFVIHFAEFFVAAIKEEIEKQVQQTMKDFTREKDRVLTKQGNLFTEEAFKKSCLAENITKKLNLSSDKEKELFIKIRKRYGEVNDVRSFVNEKTKLFKPANASTYHCFELGANEVFSESFCTKIAIFLLGHREINDERDGFVMCGDSAILTSKKRGLPEFNILYFHSNKKSVIVSAMKRLY